MNITIFGKGNMGQAIGKNFEKNSNNQVSYLSSKDSATTLGDLVVLAVPYPALESIVEKYHDELVNKIVIDITNPLNFENFDELVVPADSSSAQELQAKLPNSNVIKAFNTNFASSLQSGKVGDNTTTVLAAGNDEASKQALKDALTGSPLEVLSAGKLKRARELESMGFLQMTLAISKQIGFNGGFGVVK